MNKKPFTEQEQKIMDLIVDAYTGFCALEPDHPSDVEEFVDGIHKLQHVLIHRVASRDYPDIFRVVNSDRL